MPQQPYHAVISADGKLLHGRLTDAIATGDEIRLLLDGNLMAGGAGSATLLGCGQTFLPESRQFELTEFAPGTDGTCELTYRVR